MARIRSFSVRTEQDPPLEIVVLRCGGGGHPERALEVWVVPAFGSNLCRFTMGAKSIIDFETCSTDAHNLFDRGFMRESGLKTLKGGQVHRGSVKYKIVF